MLKPIPISTGREIAEKYGYDQVVIIARKVGDGGGEHCTTYGVNVANCAVAARIGEFVKHKLMKWPGDLGDFTEAQDAIPEIEKLLRKATPEPWSFQLAASSDDGVLVGPSGEVLRKADAKLMALVRNFLAPLLSAAKFGLAHARDGVNG
jgi:hypothetical protein